MACSKRESVVAALAAALATLALAWAWRGYVVDDAWIPARYAAHLAAGHGYRFNVDGAVTDGVTPLPWAPILVLASGGGGVARALIAARVVGVVAWTCGAAALAVAASRAGGRSARYVPLVTLALAAPLGAWSGAGLETGLAASFVAIACSAGDRDRGGLAAAIAAGLAASLRPEALPLALVLGAWAGAGLAAEARVIRVLVAALPWLVVVTLRVAIFERAAPLAVLAKPSDLAHGASYVGGFLVFGGAPILVFAPVALARGPLARARYFLAAAAVHAITVAIAGGDWMPLSRLMVPAIPPLVLAAVDIAETAPPALTLVRAVASVALLLVPWARLHHDAASVFRDRLALIDAARPALAPYRAIAILDAGWAGAATEARVVDLAGLTDPAIAMLPGGHTSKRVPATLLDARGVDAIVLLREKGCAGECVQDDGGPFERVVETRLADDRWVREAFAPVRTIEAGALVYVVLARR